MAKVNLLEAVHELWYWQYGTNPTNFTSQLYTLISKADMENKHRLAEAFPWEYAAFKAWENAPDEMEFFKAHGIIVTEKPKR